MTPSKNDSATMLAYLLGFINMCDDAYYLILYVWMDMLTKFLPVTSRIPAAAEA
jgi:hypothetical protein